MKIPFLSFKMDPRRSLCLAFLLSVATVVVRCEPTSTTELPLTATDLPTDFTTILTTEILTMETEALPTEGSTVPPLSTSVIPSSVPPVGDCGEAVCGDNEECTGGDIPVCDCMDGYQRNAETSICEVMTCSNHQCGDHGICKGNDTTFLGCECDNFSRLENGFCEQLSCDTTLLCHGPGDVCIDHMTGYMCMCNETLNRVNNPDQSDCIDVQTRTCNNSCTATNQICSDEGGYSCTSRTCDNSCTATHQICSDEGGYSCTCEDGYTKISDDMPCQEIILPTTTAEVPTEIKTAPTITAAPPAPGPGSTQEQPPQSTKAPPPAPGAGSTQEQTPKKPPTTPAPKGYTGAIVGLFIFLVATCLVFVAIYLVRRRKLRNNYGRLDEDSEGDGGWSAFSKNPIYRGDKDYQPL